jgi:hypothetical protein
VVATGEAGAPSSAFQIELPAKDLAADDYILHIELELSANAEPFRTAYPMRIIRH